MSAVSHDTSSARLKQLAARGTVWTFSGVVASQLIRLAANLITTRLLAPELFGLMALVTTVVIGLSNFSETGASASVIRDQHGEDPIFLNTAWTLQILRGLALWCVTAACAAPLAAFYGDARLCWLIPVVALNALTFGFSSTTLFTNLRRLALAPLTLLDVGTQLAAGLTMVVWAWYRPGVWPLVAGAVVAPLLRMIGSHFLDPQRRDRWCWNPAVLRQLLRFGRWIWITSALAFLAQQIDRLLLAKFLPLAAFGVYAVATIVAEVPRGLIQTIGANVLFPAYARVLEHPREQWRALIFEHRWVLLALMAVAIAVLTAAGDVFIHILFDRRYADAAWMLPILALGLWPSVLVKTLDGALLALGKPQYAAQANLVKLVFTAAAIPFSFALWGMRGAVIAVALNDLPVYVLVSIGLKREGLSGLSQDLRATALLAATISLLLGARFLAGW